jgi:putative heme iron utilization protein
METAGSALGRGAEARRLIRSGSHVGLATILDGRPYASLVAVASDFDASPLLLLSDLAQHTRNLRAEPQVSLLFEDTAGHADPLASARLSVLGRALRCDDPRAAARFAARHPESAGYSGFADFHLYRVTIDRGHFVGGFGRIAWLERDQLQLSCEAPELAVAEPEIVAHMNADHAAALDLCARRLLRRDGNGWVMTGIDPEGADLQHRSQTGAEAARLDFTEPVLTAAAARRALVMLAAAARRAIPN